MNNINEIAQEFRNYWEKFNVDLKAVLKEYAIDECNDLIIYNEPNFEIGDSSHQFLVLTTELKFLKIEVDMDSEIIIRQSCIDVSDEYPVTNSGKGCKESVGYRYVLSLIKLNRNKIK